MTVGDPTIETLPDILALLADRWVREGRRSGDAVLAASADLGRVVWANGAASALFSIAPGPQAEADGDLAKRLRDVVGEAGRTGEAGEAVTDGRGALASGEPVSWRRLVLGTPGRECLVVRVATGRDPRFEREALATLAEIGAQPVAIWSPDRSWADAGFGAMTDVHLEDLYDLRDSDAILDRSFLPGGRSIGLLKLSRGTIAVWHLGDEGFLRFDLEPQRAAAVHPERADRNEEPVGSPEDAHSFEREIRDLKTVGGSLLSAAGAALGAGLLGRLAGRTEAVTDRAEAREDEALPNEEVKPPLDERASQAGPDDGKELDERDHYEDGETHPADRTVADTGHAGEGLRDDPEGASPDENPPSAASQMPRALEVMGAGFGAAASEAFALKRGDEEHEADDAQDLALPGSGEAKEHPPFVASLAGQPIRFVWRLDQNGRFRTLSSEFARAVGPRAADVLDLSFADLAEALDLDPSGAIASLIERRDTWSDRMVLWPVQGTAKRIPVDLAALPVYSRERVFDGFRGFGVLRPADAEYDPHCTGLVLADGATMKAVVEAALEEKRASEMGTIEDDVADADEIGIEAEEDPSPVLVGADTGEEKSPEALDENASGSDIVTPGDRVVHLSERRQRRETPLSDEEAAAFRSIGAALSRADDQQNFESAIRSAKERIAEFAGQEARKSQEDRERSQTPSDIDMGGAPEPARRSYRKDASVFADLAGYYGRLPVPILVQSGDKTVFVNEEFSDLTGYRDASELAAAGGIDHLFVERSPGESVRLRRVNGGTIDVRARMQRIAVAGRSFLVISFFASPRLTVGDLSGIVSGPAGDGSEAAASAAADTMDNRLRDLMAEMDGAGEAVLVLDGTGVVEAANRRARRLFAGERAEGTASPDGAGPVGASFIDLFAPEDTGSARELLRAAQGPAAPEEPGEADLSIRSPGRSDKPVTAISQPLETGGWCVVLREGDAGGVEGEPPFRAHGEEASEAIDRARLQAEEESLRKTQFLASVAHEIRTPMTAILGFSDAIEGEAFGPIGNGRYLDYIRDIKRSARHVLDLVGDLLDLSKAEAGMLNLASSPVPLNLSVGEVVSMMQPVAGAARVVLRSNLPPSVPPVLGDERSIRQIVTNLVQNAIASTPPGGQVILSSQYREDGGVTLKCRDTGVGMSEAELEIARRPDGRIRRSGGRTGSSGTGLGLPLALAMADANGAELAFDTGPHGGTLVELRFGPDRVVGAQTRD
ncbi:histidine kinase dimerization/phospho-acceptor domain-containing protein [Fulvimarina endophytica]|uniref:histidine kinase dimerization/phospho-acceptor domain-containing protein n=1 Tax=Fulvimarina endophytica TaxID=2293836 RepID=UPI001314B7CA|nr:histidine kinase dimerization/phospho-acceptor domain-containing protein [Fulvimarina endophytica]